MNGCSIVRVRRESCGKRMCLVAAAPRDVQDIKAQIMEEAARRARIGVPGPGGVR